MKWFALLAGIMSNAAASILIKMAVNSLESPPIVDKPLAALQSGKLWLGLFLYGLAFILYAIALVKLPLNVAHPLLTAGALATVAVCSHLIFREPFHWTTIVGILLITMGTLLITLRVG